MIPFDRKNLMKCMYQLGEHRIRDQQPFTDSDYLLPSEYVDKFSDEVVSRRGPAILVGDREDNKGNKNSSGELSRTGCMSNFRAAASDETKKMWGVLEEGGYF